MRVQKRHQFFTLVSANNTPASTYNGATILVKGEQEAREMARSLTEQYGLTYNVMPVHLLVPSND